MVFPVFPTLAEDVTIAGVSDPRPRVYSRGYEILTTDLNQVTSFLSSGWNLDAFVAGGDIDYIGPGTVGGTSSTFARAYNESNLNGTPLFLVTGNHEIDNIYDVPVLNNMFSSYPDWNLKHGPNVCPNTTYSYEKGDLHVSVLNVYCGDSGDISTSGDVPNVLFDWLKNDLRNSNKKYKVVFGHEPAYPNGRHVGDSLDANPEERDRFWNLLLTEKVFGYLAGHSHISRISDIDGVFDINTGTSGSSRNSGGGADPFTTLNYIHTDNGGITLKQVKETRNELGYSPARWPLATTYTKTQADISKEVLVNTFERAGKVNKYFVDYDSTVETNPDWSSNNNGKWWEKNFVDSSWTSGETGLGYDRINFSKWGWINTNINSDPNSSGTSHVKAVFQRIPFSVYDKNLFSRLKLGLDYSGGITAWINGTKVYESPTSPTFNDASYQDNFDKNATGQRVPWGKEARVPSFQDTDISNFKNLLNNGSDNVLVVASWNQDSASSLVSGIRLTLQPESGPYKYWVSYNDGADYSNSIYASSGNVSNFGGNDGVGDLVSHYDNSLTGVDFSYSSGSSEKTGPEDNGSTGRTPPIYPNSGTDAFDEFGNKVNLGAVSYTGTGVSMILTFNNLSSEKRYELTALGMRGKYPERWCRYTLSDASSFSNASSSGTEIETLYQNNDSTIYNCGDNYQNGYVAKWTNIVPGSSSLKLTIRGVTHGSYPSNESILSAFKLAEAKPGNPTISSSSSKNLILTNSGVKINAPSITIGDDSVTPTIKNSNDIRVRIPSSLPMKWDESITNVSVSGSASGKVSSDISYENEGKTVVLNVSEDFAVDENITINGLKFTGLSATAERNNLELILDGSGGYPIAFDDKTIGIGKSSLSSAESKVFAIGGSSKTAPAITITEDSASPTITSGGDIRIKIPNNLNLIWDSDHSSLEITGSASGKIASNNVTFEDGNKTAVLDVSSDFSVSDTLFINGLYLKNATAPGSSGNLLLEVDNLGNDTDSDDKTMTVAPMPIVSISEKTAQPASAFADSDDLVLGVASIVSSSEGTGVQKIKIKENGTINAKDDLSETELWLSDDENWDVSDNRLDTGKNFSDLDGSVEFSENFTLGTTIKYLILRTNIPVTAKVGRFINFIFEEATVETDCSTSNFPLDLSTATKVDSVPITWSSDSDWNLGTSSETIFKHNNQVGIGFFDDFNGALSENKWSNDDPKWIKEGVSTGTVETSNSTGGSGIGFFHVKSASSSSSPVPSDYDTTHGVFNLPPGKTLLPRYTLWYNGVKVVENSDAATSFSRGRFGAYMYQDATHFFSVIGTTHFGAFRLSRTNGSYSNIYFAGTAATQVGVQSTAPGNPVNAKVVVNGTTASGHTHTVYATVGSPESATVAHTETTNLSGARTFAVSACYHLNQNPFESLVDSIWLRGGFENGNYTTGWKDTGETNSTWGNVTVSATISGDQTISMVARSSANGSSVAGETTSIPLLNGTSSYDISSLAAGRHLSISFVLNTGTTSDTPTINSISWNKSVSSPTEVPGAPGDLIAGENGSGGIDLIWTRNNNAEDVFYLEKQIDSGNGFSFWQEKAIMDGLVTSFSDDTGIENNKRYKYRIRSANAIGFSSYTESNIIFTTPSAPSALSLSSKGIHSLSWQWTDNSNFEEGFLLRFLTGGIAGSSNLSAGTSNYETTGLNENTLYRIALKSFKGEKYSSEINSETICTLAPPPYNFEASSTDLKNSLSVTSFANDSLGQSGYYFINKTKNTNSGWINTNSFEDSSLDNNTTYEYQVNQRNQDGIESGVICSSSDECVPRSGASLTKTTLAPVPSEISATATRETVDLTTKRFNNDNVASSGYYFENKTKGTNSGWKTENFWQETGLRCGEEYLFEVKYRNQDGTETEGVGFSKKTADCPTDSNDNSNGGNNENQNNNNNENNNNNQGGNNENQNNNNDNQSNQSDKKSFLLDDRDRKILSEEENIFVLKRKVIFKGDLIENNSAPGFIQIVRDGKIIKKVKVRNFKNWRIETREKLSERNKNHDYQFVYLDLENKVIKNSEIYSIFIDTKKPKFVDLPKFFRKNPGEKIEINAIDNDRVALYEFILRGKSYGRKSENHFILPENLPKGNSKMTIKIFDGAGNSSKKTVKIINK